MVRTGISPFKDLLSLWALYKIFVMVQPNMVLTYFVKPNIWGMLAAALAHVPRRIAMVEGMGYVFTENSIGRRTLRQLVLGWLIMRLYQLSFIAADRVIVLNVDDLRDLRSSCGLRPSKAFLLGGIGVSLEEWQMQVPVLNPITFTMVARITREKGVFEFLNAAKQIKMQFPDVRFMLLGGGDDNPGAIDKQSLQALDVESCVDLLGHVDVKPWLSRSSVFVLPSYREGVPRSTQEAMALGLPIITTDVPGCRETVVEMVNGFLVPPRDSLQLADAMKRFILQPELIERMGRESRRLAEQRFDVRSVNDKLMGALGI